MKNPKAWTLALYRLHRMPEWPVPTDQSEAMIRAIQLEAWQAGVRAAKTTIGEKVESKRGWVTELDLETWLSRLEAQGPFPSGDGHMSTSAAVHCQECGRDGLIGERWVNSDLCDPCLSRDLDRRDAARG